MTELDLLRRLAAMAMLLCLPIAVGAEDGDAIEEIVVTADFRDSGINSLPASVSVIRPNERGTIVNHLEEVLGQAPNVNYASGASRGRFIQIRGIGERGQFSEPLNSSVGLLVDGVDLSGIGTAATLFDVEQVEILRGPQGTLYGANALAGLINVVSKSPTPEHTASVRLDAGDYGAFGIGAVVAGPIGDTAGYRLSYQSYRDDGFMDNDFLGRENTDNHAERSYRAKFVWETGAAAWSLVAGRADIDNGYDAFSLDNDRRTRSDDPGRDEQVTDYGALSLTYDMASTQLQATGSFASSNIDYGYDEDWTFDGFDPIGYVSTDRYLRDRDTQTLDVRLLSSEDASFGGWDWVVGGYALRQDVDLRRIYAFLPGPFDSEFSIERLAVYGEIKRGFGDGWRLTLGARGERHASEYDDSDGISFDPDDDLFGGKLLLERDIGEDRLVYAGVSRGYKAGGFNQDGTLAPEFREFDPEDLWNIELGYKATVLDGRLTIRSAIFRMQREDIQISTSTTLPIPGNPGAVEFIQFTGNAAEGFNQGVELELTYEASAALQLFLNVGFLDTEYEDFIDNSGRDLDGREQAHAPSYQFFVGGEYFFTDRWSARLEVEGKDEFFFSDSHAIRSDAYELINASIGYEGDGWGVRLWGRNLTDEDYLVRGFFFGNDPRDFYTARGFTQLGEPRQYGVSVSVDL